MYYYIQTFGCQMNEHDSAMIASLLENTGYQPVGQEAEADLIVVNTCCVRQTAENKAYGYIGSLKQYKQAKPGLTIVVCGCMVQKDGTSETLLQKARHVGVLIGTFAISRLPQYILDYQRQGRAIVDIEESYDEPRTEAAVVQADLPFKAQINIIYGCNNFCSYCIVPYVRGRERSRQPAEILQQAAALVQGGVKEIQLLGQNVNSYGKDFSDLGWNFARLLRELDTLPGLERIRYMTSHPRDFSEELIDTVAASEHICHHFHLPIQSGCDKQLQAMNRGYTRESYRRLLTNIRTAVPDATITSDLIIGFPGETEEDFQQTLDFLQECQFDAAYTFLYSQRSGTPAADMPEQIPAEIKKERIQRLLDAQNPISLQQNQKLIGQRQQILAEGPSKNNPDSWSGRNDGNKIVIFPYRPGLQIGDALEVTITEAQTWNLYGA